MTKEKAPDKTKLKSTPTVDESAQAVVRPPHIALLLIVVAIAVCWWFFLGRLAITTANPVTFNRRQILESDMLVVATITKIGEDGTLDITIDEELLHDDPTKNMQILHSTLPLLKGKKYIFPVSRTLDLGYSITRTKLPDKPPLVYPANKETVTKLKAEIEAWRQTFRDRQASQKSSQAKKQKINSTNNQEKQP